MKMDLQGYGNYIAAAGAVAAAAAGSYLMSGGGLQPLDYPIDVNNQSVEVAPGVYGSKLVPDGRIVETIFDDVHTLYDGFQRGLRVSNGGDCLGYRPAPGAPYKWINYQEVSDQAQRIGSFLNHKGLKPGDESFVGIYSMNRPEWVIAEQACNMFSLVAVPLYDTLGPDACAYILNQTTQSTTICDTSEKAILLLGCVKTGAVNCLKMLIVMDAISEELSKLAKECNVELFTFKEAMDTGAKNLMNPIPPKPDNVATICYTSGTTGNPKGVQLTHKNITSNPAAVVMLMKDFESVGSSDLHISYLPLAHMFERVVQAMIYSHGARVGFFSGDIKLLTQDLMTLKPTIFATVPRLLNRVYDKVQAGVKASAVKSFLYNVAFSRKKALLDKGIITNQTIWDTLVFSKVQATLGGRVRFVVTGSAPLSREVLDFCRVAFGCTVFEGYGQTECTAGATFTIPTETNTGLVGCPLPCSHVKLADVPDMEYFAKDKKGEVCIKGANVMKGYYREPQKTAEAIDEDGWLHTGDIGQWLPNGTLKLIDRKKHLFKLAQGEYLAPEKIENIYVRSSYVAQAFVDGDSLQTFAVAVIVPDEETVFPWAQKQGLPQDMNVLCNNEKLKKFIFEDMKKMAKESKLKGFEQAREVYLFPELFSIDNGLLTPTFKAKRPALRKHFADKVKEMYAKAQ